MNMLNFFWSSDPWPSWSFKVKFELCDNSTKKDLYHSEMESMVFSSDSLASLNSRLKMVFISISENGNQSNFEEIDHWFG